MLTKEVIVIGYTLTVEDGPEDRKLPENTLLRATLLEIKKETVNYTDRQSGLPASFDKFTWWFQITSDDKYNGRRVKGRTPALMSDRGGQQLREWVQTMRNVDSLPVGEKFDTDSLLGLPVELLVKHVPDSRDPSKTWEEVEMLSPISGGYDVNNPPF